MRVTNSMLVNSFMNNLNTNMSKLSKLQNQLASGRKYANISDDPTALIYSQSARNKINRLAHYQSSVGNAQEWLTQSESGVVELQSILASAQEACVQASTDVLGGEDKANVSEYIKQLRDHFVDTLNASYGDKYVFGGYNTIGVNSDPDSSGPFSIGTYGDPPEDGLYYNGRLISGGNTVPASLSNDVLSFDVGPGVSMDVTINGIELVNFEAQDENGNTVEYNIFDILNDLYKKANAGAPAAEISESIKPLQSAQSHLLSKAAEIGGRTNRLDLLSSRYEQDEINYLQMKSNAEDADYSEIIMNQKMAEAVYQAALSAGATIIQPTLMDFLR